MTEDSGSDHRQDPARTLTEDRIAEDFPRWLVWLARLWLLVALCGAGFLVAVSFSGAAVAGCGPGSGCNQVLASRWAYWFGLPVSLPGFVVYFFLLASTWALGRTSMRI